MKLRPIILAAALAIALVDAATPASATNIEATNTEEVCTVGSVAVREGESVPAEIPLVVSCFTSLAAAEEFIEAGAPGDLEQLVPKARGDGVVKAFRTHQVDLSRAHSSP